MIHDVHVMPCTTSWGAAPAKPHRTPWMRPSLPGAQTSVDNEAVRMGKAWLVGCGPGSTDHLTLRAVRLLKAADVILYDDLGAEAAVKEFAPKTVELVYVGKRGGRPSISQPLIDDILVRHCRQGKSVVRLKGGCPSVFSRCSSELLALDVAGCEAELVPGVSSALAAPLFAGFPLTDAEVGKSFAVMSGHKPEDTDWSAFSKIDTLVVLMVGRNLATLMGLLEREGWDPAMPVALVRAAGQPEQKIWKGTIDTIMKITQGAGPLSPCVLIIGNIVLRAQSISTC